MSGERDWAILYLRPDGWWVGGEPFGSKREATAAAKRHNWRGSKWQVVASDEVDAILCEEARDERAEAGA
jgi:hypothetical protein